MAARPGTAGAAAWSALRRGLAARGHRLAFLPLSPRQAERVPLPCAVPLRVPRRSEGRLCARLPRAAFLYAIFTG